METTRKTRKPAGSWSGTWNRPLRGSVADLERHRRARRDLDAIIAQLEEHGLQLHQLTADVQARRCDLNPAARPRLEAEARRLARIRDLAQIALGTLARAGVEPARERAPLVLTGPGGDYRTAYDPAHVLGQRLDLEA